MPELILNQCHNCKHYEEEYNKMLTNIDWGWCKYHTSTISIMLNYRMLGSTSFMRVQVSYNNSCIEHSKK
jgi:hypothetical protein